MPTENGAPSRAAKAEFRWIPPPTLWDGTKVNGPIELRQALLHYSPQFVRTITEEADDFRLGPGSGIRRYAGDPVHRA